MTETEEKPYHAAIELVNGETFYTILPNGLLDARDARGQWRAYHEPWPVMIPAESREGSPVLVMTGSIALVRFFAGPVPSRVGKAGPAA
jgi:hypothetical protein